MATSLLGFVVAETFAHFVVLYVVWALSTALHSGTADAWLYDALRESLREDEFARVRGRGGAVYEWTSAGTMIAGGLLYVAHPTYPFVASAALHCLGMVLVTSVPRNAQYRRGATDGGEQAGKTDESTAADSTGGTDDATAADDRRSRTDDESGGVGVRGSLSVTRTVLFSRDLRTFVAFVACFFAVIQATDTFIQPIAEGVLADALAGVTVGGRSIPEPALLGVLYACFAAVGAIASDRTGAVRARLDARSAVALLAVGVALALLVPWFVAALAIPAFVLLKGAHALSKPLVAQYVNDRTGSAARATILSATSMGFALVRAPLKPVAGAVADATSPVATVALLGVGLLAVTLLFTVRTGRWRALVW